MNEAMGYFAPIQEKDFPPELRAHARAVLGVRDIYRQQDVMGVWFTYSDMRPKDRDAWALALMTLYDTLKYDEGRMAERQEKRKTR